MKKLALVIVLALCTSLTFGQKVKIKKGIVTVDDVEVYKIDKEGSMETLSTMASNEFLSILSTTYEVRNEAHYRPNGQNFPAMITKWIFTVKFLESGKDLATDLSPKDIIKAVYKSEMVDANGKIDEEKLNIFINKYNNENLKYKL
ncbi:MAG TPA: hypothetical protein VK623_07155 [Flavobacterium sp.]|nr:hypothetical protein [Flavobacterium sp.]